MSGGFPFSPADHKTYTLAVTTTSGSRQIRTELGHRQTWRIYNAGTDLVFVRFTNLVGTAATIPSGATEGDFPIPSGVTEVFSTQQLFLAAIAAATTATLYISIGDGGP